MTGATGPKSRSGATEPKKVPFLAHSFAYQLPTLAQRTMDNPSASRSSLLALRKRDSSATAATADLISIGSDINTNDTDSTSVHSAGSYGRSDASGSSDQYFPHGHHHHHHHHHKHRNPITYFTRHMKMTPLEKEQAKKPASAPKHADSVKRSYHRECERWYVTCKLNKHEKDTDPLTYATTRLECFLQLYDSVLQGDGTIKQAVMEDKMDRVGFWSCQALKMITGVKNTITYDVLADFSNNELKKKEKMKALYLMGDYFATQWSWQLATDNPETEFYSYTLGPILYTAFSEYRTSIGPHNHHIIHGNSMADISFSKSSFSSAICYDLWLHVQKDDWVSVFSEVNRLLRPRGRICLFLMDFTILNCKNELYSGFFKKVQGILDREGIDPFPTRRVQANLSRAGFVDTRYAFITLKKGLNSKMGNIMELLQGFFEMVIFTKIAQLSLTEEELEMFKEVRIQYNHDLRNGHLMDEFGDSYYMFVLSDKAAAG